jgi:hypothetical protein
MVSRWARAACRVTAGLNLSSATIRNVMADLEELGFVSSPHTSAGRVPTDKGYRFFVDTLLRVQPLDHDSVSEFRRQLDGGHDAKALVATASQLLSSVTQLAGVVTLPSSQQSDHHPHRIRAAVGEPRAGGAGARQQRSAEPHHPAGAPFPGRGAARAANFLNQQLRRPFSPARCARRSCGRCARPARHMNQIMLDAITMAQQVFNVGDPGCTSKMDYVIAGETNLMGVGGALQRREAQAPVRGLQRTARLPAPAGPQPQGPGRPDFHRPRIRLPDPGRLQPGDGSVFAGRPGGRGAGGHRPDAHGLRTGHSHCRCHGEIAGRGLEFQALALRNQLICDPLMAGATLLGLRKLLFFWRY